MIDLKNLPREVVDIYLRFPQRNEFLPVAVRDGKLQVHLLKERATPLADFLAWRLGMPVSTDLVPEETFYPLFEQALGLWEEESHGEDRKDEDFEDDSDGQDLLGWSHEDAPIVRLVNKTVHQAISQSASDIHFERQGNHFCVRFRLDGELHTVKRLDKSLQPTIVARIKVMSEMDVAESRTPQDGRIRVRIGQKDVDLRVSTVPTMNGEKAVLRILDRTKTILSLPDLGMEGNELTMFRQAIARPHGIILVTGPTGSGKTTTLYAGLSEIVGEARNIMTIEDPVEYHLDGVNQVQVNRAAEVTFAKAIRAFLRQDPDVILVGEIRDQETAGAAIQASLTGHLVLSTLHTNDAATSITRLLEMGLEPFLVASSLTLVMGQRLVRINCPHCARPAKVSQASLQLLKVKTSREFVQHKGTGCEKCMHTGFKGRQGIFEFLPVDEQMQELIMERASSDKLKALGKAKGCRSMLEHGLTLVAQKKTTVEEILRVTRL